MKKKMICVLLILCMVISCFPAQAFAEVTSDVPLEDVGKDDWFYDSVEYVHKSGLMIGTGDNVFSPFGTMTRAMFVTVLGRLDGVDTSLYTSSSSLDVSDGMWYSEYIAWSEENKIITGYGDGNFGTDDPITREQMATIIARYVSSKNFVLQEVGDAADEFRDASAISNWATEGLELMRLSGIIKGDESGNFNANKYASRAEAAAVFMRLENAVESAKPEAIVLTVDTSNIEYSPLEDSYYIFEKLENLTGNLSSEGNITAFSYKVYNDKDMLIETGDIDVSESWSINNIGLFIGKNKIEISATSADYNKTTVIYITDVYGENYDQLDGYDIDTDGDEIYDYVEDYLGTDKYSADSDGDGLTDYEEVCILGTDPLKADSDDNGISDYDEDQDRDGLSNGFELSIDTNPMSEDTDCDGLTDYEELYVYGTDPLLLDTDSDGATDGWEIENGFDPLTYNDYFNTQIETEDEDVTASVSAVLNGEQAATLQISAVESSDILSEVPGSIGNAYDFAVNGQLDEALVNFEFDKSLLNDSNFTPTIYCYNEETQLLEEIETTISGNQASATVDQQSTYILINKDEYDSVWTSKMALPQENQDLSDYGQSSILSVSDTLENLYDLSEDEVNDYYTDSNGDGISDYFTKKLCDGELLLGTGEVTPFYGVSYDSIQASNDFDGDGLLNGEELIVEYNDSTDTIYVTMKSDPTKKDTDGDGWIDSEDSNPMEWDVGARDLAMFAALAYEDGTDYIGSIYDESSIIGGKSFEVENGQSYYFLDYADISEVSDEWQIVDFVNQEVATSTYFSATTYKNGDNIIVAYRGTDDDAEWIHNFIGIGLVNYHIEEGYAESYAAKIANQYPNCTIHITGHSLGGYLAQFGAASICENVNTANLEQVSYFNGVGLKYNKLLFWTKNDTLNTLKSYYNSSTKNLISYYIYGDVVSAIGTHSGYTQGFYAAAGAISHHAGQYGTSGTADFISKILLSGACLLTSSNFLKYYKYYGSKSITEYLSLTHETDSFFYHCTQGTRG